MCMWGRIPEDRPVVSASMQESSVADSSPEASDSSPEVSSEV